MRRSHVFAVLLVLLALGLWASCSALDDPPPVPGESSTAAADDDAEIAREDRVDAPRKRRRRSRGEDDAERTGDGGPLTEAWTVDVVDPSGSGVPGVRMRIGYKDFYSDVEGRIDLGEHPVEGTVEVLCDALGSEKIELTEPHSRVEVPACIPLLVTVVDGETGAEVSGVRVRLKLPGKPLALVRTHRGFELERAPFHAARRAWVRLELLLPDGYGRDPGTDQYVTIEPSRFAAEIHVPLVVRPAVPVTVRVREIDGTPAEGAKVARVSLDGDSLWSVGAPAADAKGVIPVPRVPYLRDEILVVTVGKDERHASTEGVRLTAADVPLRLDVTLPEETSELSYGGIGGGSSGRFMHPRYAKVKSGPGSISFYVRRRNGDPAAGALVRLNGQRTVRVDGRGYGEFKGLADGGYSLILDEPGLVRTVQKVGLVDGGTSHAEIVEGAGVSRRLRLTNEHGTPLPFARVTLNWQSTSSTLTHLDGDVQRAWFLTDANGELRIDHIPQTRHMLTAVYGHRKAIKFLSDQEEVVDLILRRPGSGSGSGSSNGR